MGSSVPYNDHAISFQKDAAKNIDLVDQDSCADSLFAQRVSLDWC
jgi:hypothetical protein